MNIVPRRLLLLLLGLHLYPSAARGPHTSFRFQGKFACLRTAGEIRVKIRVHACLLFMACYVIIN